MHSLAPTPFHCATASLSKLEDELSHHSLYGHAIILVVGTLGSGRSHLSSRLQVLLSRSLPAGVVEAHPMLSEEQLNADALTQLGLHQLAAGGMGLASAVARAPAGRRVLIIDNAHDLHASILRELLLTCAAEGKREDPRLLLILFGDEILDAALADIDYAGLEADDFRRVVMPVWQADDARRMALLWAASHNFPEPDAHLVALAHNQSHGHPGPFLEALATSAQALSGDDFLSDEHQDDYAESDVEPTQQFGNADSSAVASASSDELLRTDAPVSVRAERIEAMTGQPLMHRLTTSLIAAGVLALALLVLYQTEINAWLEGAAPSGGNTVTMPVAQLDGARTAIDLPMQAESSADAVADLSESVTQDEPALNAAQNESLTLTTSTTEPEPSRQSLVVAQPVLKTQTSTSSQNTPAPSAAKPVVATAIETKAEVKPQLAAKSEPKPVLAVESKATVAKPVAVANPSALSAQQPGKATPSFSADEEALLNASPEHWVVQIVGLSDESAMRTFIREHGLSHVRYYRAKHKTKFWFVLVQADFSEHAAAVRARDALPPAVAALGPWLKPMKVVQQEIKNAGVKQP